MPSASGASIAGVELRRKPTGAPAAGETLRQRPPWAAEFPAMASARLWVYSNGMDNERRSGLRHALSRLAVYDLGLERYIDTRACDVSRGGVSFISDEYLEPNTQVWVTFPTVDGMGGERELESQGSVSSVVDLPGGCRFGVSLERMTPDDRAAFEAFVDRLEAGESGSRPERAG